MNVTRSITGLGLALVPRVPPGPCQQTRAMPTTPGSQDITVATSRLLSSPDFYNGANNVSLSKTEFEYGTRDHV
jgi:hypothetical protein